MAEGADDTAIFRYSEDGVAVDGEKGLMRFEGGIVGARVGFFATKASCCLDLVKVPRVSPGP